MDTLLTNLESGRDKRVLLVKAKYGEWERPEVADYDEAILIDLQAQPSWVGPIRWLATGAFLSLIGVVAGVLALVGLQL